jgi:hypothetical protein
MKINWGTAIVIVFILFAGMLTYVMIQSAQNRSDLVAEDYYEQEINYDARIESKTNAKALGEIQTTRLDNNLLITFPATLPSTGINGDMHFYKPNNASLDFEVPISIDENNAMMVDLTNVIKGKWVLKIELISAGKTYYWEQQISI